MQRHVNPVTIYIVTPIPLGGKSWRSTPATYCLLPLPPTSGVNTPPVATPIPICSSPLGRLVRPSSRSRRPKPSASSAQLAKNASNTRWRPTRTQVSGVERLRKNDGFSVGSTKQHSDRPDAALRSIRPRGRVGSQSRRNRTHECQRVSVGEAAPTVSPLFRRFRHRDSPQ